MNEPFDLRQYAQAVNGRKWLILVLVLATIATTFFLGNQQAPVYETSVTVTLNDTASKILKLPTTLNQIIGSDALLTDIITDTGLDETVSELRTRIHAEIINDTGLIIIKVRSSQRNKTKLIADAVATRFLDASSELDTDRKARNKKQKQVAAELAAVEQRIKSTKTELSRSQQSDISDVAKATYASGLRSELSSLASYRYSLATAALEAPPQSEIIARAVKPSAPLLTNRSRNLVLSAVAALLFGISISIVFPTRPVEDASPVA